jgi:hypothetical protein
MRAVSFTSNAEELARTFANYAKLNGRELEPLFVEENRKLATELYTQTALIAPTKAEIAADVKALGWKIPKWFHKGGKRGWRFGRGKAKAGKKETLEEMEAKVIRIRTNHAKYIASGWLGAIIALGGKTSSKVDPERGGIEVSHSPGQVEITIWNASDGVVTMDNKKNFSGKAMGNRRLDMLGYIARKLSEAGIPHQA